MNSFIVIFIIIRSWLKNIKYDLTKFFFCILGLIISIYIYGIYNTVIEQDVSLNTKKIGNCSEQVDYYIPLSCFFEEDNESVYKEIITEHYKTEIGTDEIYSISYIYQISDSIVNLIDSIQYPFRGEITKKICCNVIIENSLTYNYKSNNWLSLHRKYNEGYYHSDFNIDSANHAILCSYDYDFTPKYPKDGKILSFEKNETFYTNKNLYVDSIFDKEQLYICSIPIEKKYSNTWYDTHDISKFKFKAEIETKNIGNVRFLYTDEQISEVFPQPDEWGNGYFVFKSKEKLEDISRNGLQMSIYFPANEPIQTARNFILSAFITLFLTFCCTFSYAIILSKIKTRRRRIQIVNKLLNSNKFDYANKLFVPIILQNLCMSFMFGIFFNIIMKEYINICYILMTIIIVHVLWCSLFYYFYIQKNDSTFLIIEKNRAFASIIIASLGFIICLKFLPFVINDQIFYILTNGIAYIVVYTISGIYITIQVRKIYFLYKNGISFYNKCGKFILVKYIIYTITFCIFSVISSLFCIDLEDISYSQFSDISTITILFILILLVIMDLYTYRRRLI